MNLTLLTKLKAAYTDSWDYSTYVFELVEPTDRQQFGTKYITCTRFPNWEGYIPKPDETGYLELEEHKAGQTAWWDGKGYQVHKCNVVQFLHFTKKYEQIETEIIL